MAASLTLLSVSPNAVKYRYAYDGAGSLTASRSKAEMIVDAKTAGPGPSKLAALLEGTADNAALVALADSSDLMISLTPEIQSVAASTLSALMTAAVPGLAVVGVALANLDRAIVEVRANVSPSK